MTIEVHKRTAKINDFREDTFKSLYPHIALQNNIAPNTQIGRIVIHEKIYANENAYGIPEEKYSRGGEFIENMITDNHIEFCHRWFNLAGVMEFLQDIDEYYKHSGLGRYHDIIYPKDSGYEIPFAPIVDNKQAPIWFDNNPVESPIIFNYDYDKDIISGKVVA